MFLNFFTKIDELEELKVLMEINYLINESHRQR